MDNWDKIPGQEKLKRYFTRALEGRKISHAYILEGEPGTPKRELAEAFARMLQCEKGTGCGTCHSCKAFDSGNHPDVIRVRHEKPDTLSVGDIRTQLVDDMGIRPYSSPWKIYLVDEAEKMNVQAQNALLKTLEEPPCYGVILLVTVNAGSFLPTILSRAVLLKCQNEGNGTDLLEPECRQQILSVLKSAWELDRTAMAEAAAAWRKAEIPANLLANQIRLWIRDVLVWKETGSDRQLHDRSDLRGIREAADRYEPAQLQRILEAVDRMESRVAANVNYELAVEMCLFAMKAGRKVREEDPWHDMEFPDFEEARFYSESYESTLY